METQTLKYYLDDRAYPPHHGTDGSAGLDLYVTKSADVPPNEVVRFPTGVHVEIPQNHVGLVVIRSGLGFQGISLANSVGIIDSDYRGEIGIALVNHGQETVSVLQGTRVAQLLVMPVPSLKLVELFDLSELGQTARGAGGFGSTGMN